MLTFGESPSPLPVNVVYERPLRKIMKVFQCVVIRTHTSLKNNLRIFQIIADENCFRIATSNAEAAMGHWDSSIKHLTLPWDAHGIRMVCAIYWLRLYQNQKPKVEKYYLALIFHNEN